MHFETANYLCKLVIFIDLQGPGMKLNVIECGLDIWLSNLPILV